MSILRYLMSILRYLIGATALFILSSCNQMYMGYYTEMNHFSDDDLEWSSPYKEGDTVFFLSNRNNVDTMICDSYLYRDKQYPLFINYLISNKSDGPSTTNLGQTFPIKTANGNIRNWHLNIHRKSLDRLGIWTDFNDKCFTHIFIYDNDKVIFENKGEVKDSLNEIAYPIKPVVIGDTVYEDAIILDSDYFLSGRYKSAEQIIEEGWDIKRYVIAKNEGLVMYETMDGEIFVKQPAEKHPFIPPKHHWWYGLFFGFRYYLLC